MEPTFLICESRESASETGKEGETCHWRAQVLVQFGGTRSHGKQRLGGGHKSILRDSVCCQPWLASPAPGSASALKCSRGRYHSKSGWAPLLSWLQNLTCASAVIHPSQPPHPPHPPSKGYPVCTDKSKRNMLMGHKPGLKEGLLQRSSPVAAPPGDGSWGYLDIWCQPCWGTWVADLAVTCR